MTTAVEHWSSPPVDDVGYVSSEKLLALRDEDLMDLVINFEQTRYKGWRNWNGNWRRVLKMDETFDKRVLEYGCGVGIEALQYAKAGNEVTVSDIVPANIQLAVRVLRLFGYQAKQDALNYDIPKMDVIHCSGCLHHIPNPWLIVTAMAKMLVAGGELRLMLYSDWAWRIATGLEPPEDTPSHPLFETYVRRWDAVGDFAEWYDDEKLERWFGKWFRLENFEYLTQDMAYCGAVLIKR